MQTELKKEIDKIIWSRPKTIGELLERAEEDGKNLAAENIKNNKQEISADVIEKVEDTNVKNINNTEENVNNENNADATIDTIDDVKNINTDVNNTSTISTNETETETETETNTITKNINGELKEGTIICLKPGNLNKIGEFTHYARKAGVIWVNMFKKNSLDHMAKPWACKIDECEIVFDGKELNPKYEINSNGSYKIK